MAERTGSCPPTHCNVLFGLKPHQPNCRRAANSFSSSAPLSNLALRGHTTAMPQSAPTSCTTLLFKKSREAGPSQHLGTPIVRFNQTSFVEKHTERETEDIQRHCITKIRTAEVTICMLGPPQHVRRRLPLRSTAHLEVANPCLGDYEEGGDPRFYVCQTPNAFICVSILGPFWVHFGSILGPFWVHFGSIWGPFGVHFGVHLGSIWGPFWGPSCLLSEC